LATGKSSGADGVDTIRNIENISGGAHNDTLTGNSGDNTLQGNRGNDILDGGAGIDWVSYSDASGAVTVNLATGKSSGADGVDTIRNIENISGGAHNDTFIGNSGLNILFGGLGSDGLYGGIDRVRDIFDFNSITESKVGVARDRIYDFVAKIDKIDLSGIDASTKASGDQVFKFTATTAKANSVWYKSADVDGSSKTKDIIIYGDVNGDAKADFEIGLVGVTSIASTDFIL
jgi:Ca2+-binding RTX toxin-like protein